MKPDYPVKFSCLVIALAAAVTVIFTPGFAYTQNSQTTVTIDTRQPELLNELMLYINDTYGSYAVTGIAPGDADELIKKNQNDTALVNRIDRLLEHPAYRYLAELMQAQLAGRTVKGADAYRLAFVSLPWRQVDMSAGYITRLTEYYSLGYMQSAMDIAGYVKNNQSRARDTVLSMVSDLIPPGCGCYGPVNICMVIDGNRGSFAEGNDIIMELTPYRTADTALFLITAAHEMHHVLYGKWLDMHYSDSSLSAPQKVIYDWQMRMIYEGTAQQVNFRMYPPGVKALYADKSLIAELFTYWTDAFLKLRSSADAESDYSAMRKYLYNTFSVELLRKYYGTGFNELLPYRPTIDYYISYHIYNTIYSVKGKTGLEYVMLHPGELLSSCNDCITGESILPPIPGELVTLWRDVLLQAKTRE